nr:MAG TPA: hypothetical protein [Caudoviricetes sp.]
MKFRKAEACKRSKSTGNGPYAVQIHFGVGNDWL